MEDIAAVWARALSTPRGIRLKAKSKPDARAMRMSVYQWRWKKKRREKAAILEDAFVVAPKEVEGQWYLYIIPDYIAADVLGVEVEDL